MAEDQGVNGDIWNDCAVHLMELLGWSHIGDKNMDLPGIDSKSHGIDALMRYETPQMAIPQSCLLESKRYAVESLNNTTVRNWIEALRKKIELFAHSEELNEEFPPLKDCCSINLGLIMCWVHNAPNETYFEDTFSKYLSASIFNTAATKHTFKRIMVFSNSRILRLCAIAAKMKEAANAYKFVYPSQLTGGQPMVKSSILSIEYACSDIILAERFIQNEFCKVVFFLGKLSITSLKSLKDSLTFYNFIEHGKKLLIFYYGSHVENRKTIAEAANIFNGIELEIKPLQKLDFTTEPSILIDQQ